MNVIFLDVDGVLNSVNDKYSMYLETDKHFDLLKELVDKTNAMIVLSSSWRLGFSPATHEPDRILAKKLGERGMFIYDFTPCMTSSRGDEIREWLKIHSVDKFVILDDEEVDCENLVQTDTNIGLQRKNIEEAIKIMKGAFDS